MKHIPMVINIDGSTSTMQGPGVSRTVMVREVNTLAITYEHPPYDDSYIRLPM